MDHIDDEIPGAGTEGALPTDSRPLGYWLRQVDARLTREFATVLADEGVTRRDWMLLNAVSGDVDVPGLAERLARKGKRLAGLERRGWVDEAGDGTWTLTAEGRAAKDRIASLVGDIRGRVAGAVPPEDFATTMTSLEAIARELGWTEDAASDRGRGFGPRFGRGFGPGFGRGFHPGWGRAFVPGRGEGWGPDNEFGPGHGFGPGHEFGPGHGHGHGHDFEHDPRCGHGHGHEHYAHGGHYGDPDHTHGHRPHAHHHGHRRHDHSDRHDNRRGAEHAYERGFDAGYARATAERD